MSLPKCTKCESEYTYLDGEMFVCPECGNEWKEETIEEKVFKDANGNVLVNGDTVMVVKDLKINGSSTKVVKKGTKVKGIRLKEDGDHDIDCKVEGFGRMELKTEFVKKV